MHAALTIAWLSTNTSNEYVNCINCDWNDVWLNQMLTKLIINKIMSLIKIVWLCKEIGKLTGIMCYVKH